MSFHSTQPEKGCQLLLRKETTYIFIAKEQIL